MLRLEGMLRLNGFKITIRRPICFTIFPVFLVFSAIFVWKTEREIHRGVFAWIFYPIFGREKPLEANRLIGYAYKSRKIIFLRILRPFLKFEKRLKLLKIQFSEQPSRVVGGVGRK